MSFFDDQEDDWFANDCKGSPDDYYAGELAPWRDDFTSHAMETEVKTEDKKSRRRNYKQCKSAKKRTESQ